ncbi:MAG: leucine-rich repeat domain-containing protein [Flavobacteriales bacterium]|nr:leucine-rich repeat domain-containing protein [Flavobacteriales bacterium]
MEPVGYTKISDGNGNVVAIEKTTTGGNAISEYGKNECANSTEAKLKANYEKDQSKFESKTKSEYTKKGLEDASAYINKALFFTYIPQDLEIYYVKNKDGGYDDLEKAVGIAVEGFEAIKDDAESKDGIAKLTQAASIWEKALAESDPNNKDARIDKKVTLQISQNLATAYLYLLDFEKAKSVIQKALDLEKNFTTDGTREREALLAIIKENSKGYAVNKNNPINIQVAKIAITTHPSSEIKAFEADYQKYGYAEAAGELKAAKEEYDKGVESGEINPYQKFVVETSFGKQLTLPDLGAKLLKDPAGDKLDELPEAVTQLSDLNILILRGNNLKSLPASIGNLTELKKLNLTNNQLTGLPDELGQLKNLKTLVLKGNSISAADISKIQGMLPDCDIKQ